MPLGGGEGSNTWRWLQPTKQDGQVHDEMETKWSEVAIMPLDKTLNVEAANKIEMIEGYVVVRSDLRGSKLR